VDFNIPPEDDTAITMIIARAKRELEGKGIAIDKQSAHIDMIACHKDVPLDLKKMLRADNFNFAHDFLGIRNHMNRETGKLSKHFLPRCALSEKDVA